MQGDCTGGTYRIMRGVPAPCLLCGQVGCDVWHPFTPLVIPALTPIAEARIVAILRGLTPPVEDGV